MIFGFNIFAVLTVALTGYLLGNFQTAVIVSRLCFKDDIRRYGSGNAGTTNMLRVYGSLFGLVTFMGDGLKCMTAVLLSRYLAPMLLLHSDYQTAITVGGYIAGLFTLIGHCYPVLFGFKGGKGAASALPFMWLLSWSAALPTTICGLLIMLFSKKVSLVSVMCAVLFSIFAGIFTLLPYLQEPYAIFFALAASVLVLVRHIPNISRLVRGEEKELSLRSNKYPHP